MKKTHAELMADVLALAFVASESNQPLLENALMLIIRVSRLPWAVKSLLCSSGCLLVQAFEAGKDGEQ